MASWHDARKGIVTRGEEEGVGGEVVGFRLGGFLNKGQGGRSELQERDVVLEE
jgi:hypothetical protein